MVHGTEEAQKALDASKALFVSGGNSENMPTTELTAADLDENGAVAVADLLVKTGLAPSKAEAKRLIKQGGISLDDQKVTAFDAVVNKDAFAQGHVILKKARRSSTRSLWQTKTEQQKARKKFSVPFYCCCCASSSSRSIKRLTSLRWAGVHRVSFCCTSVCR